VAEAVGLGDVQVTAPATHDTASAVAAVPTAATTVSPMPDWCYLSSGTWSLMGVEVPAAITGPKALEYNVTNEGGVAGTYRTLKNIMGLWLVQECRRHWQRGGRDLDYDTLTERAAAAPPFRSLVEPDDNRFLAPGDLPGRIADFCRETHQPVPEDEGAVVRCALESLAFKYRRVLEQVEELTGGRIETVHVVGGGVQNRLLCQLTADACRRRVLAGPVEATAAGNVVMQAVAHGELASVAEGRALIRRSFPLAEYEPRPSEASEGAYQRYLQLNR
jgi:rhamnulokinase